MSIVGLAPMDGITDLPFRLIVKEYGDPDVVLTEFIHAIPLVDYFENVSHILHYKESERPIIAQIFGKDPAYFYKAACIIFSLGFDGIDINMGCPDKKVVRSGGGASLIGNEKLVFKLVQALRKARDEFLSTGDKILSKQHGEFIKIQKERFKIKKVSSFPTISIKTRIGKSENELESWMPMLNKTRVDFISLHGRTLKQMYRGKADWEAIGWAAKHSEIPLFGNGDIQHYDEAQKKIKSYNLKGVLIGRAALGNPFVFRENYKDIDYSLAKRKEIMLKHLKYFKIYKDERKFYEMKKHLGWYLKGFKGCREKRIQIMESRSFEEMVNLIASMTFSTSL